MSEMSRFKLGLAASAALAMACLSVSSAQAAVFNVLGDANDGIIQDVNQGPATNEGELIVGRAGFDASRAAVFVFQLPALGVGETISDAVLTNPLNQTQGTPLFNVDAYAVRVTGT